MAKPCILHPFFLELALEPALVIDAPDECDENEHVKQSNSLLPRIQESKVVGLRVFITSRPEFVINNGFRKLSRDDQDDVALHEIPAENDEQDISLVIRGRLLKIRMERQLPSDDVYNWLDEDDDFSNWPVESEIAQLVQIAIPLFISASTICRFIEDPKVDTLQFQYGTLFRGSKSRLLTARLS
ncbi:hypothetical protein AtubIFM57258_005153 [Aspergillus tubingensis]|nr:hypothetical protein AtubIFM57258_005153 [Aspergillus tubingensis]